MVQCSVENSFIIYKLSLLPVRQVAFSYSLKFAMQNLSLYDKKNLSRLWTFDSNKSIQTKVYNFMTKKSSCTVKKDYHKIKSVWSFLITRYEVCPFHALGSSFLHQNSIDLQWLNMQHTWMTTLPLVIIKWATSH